MKTKTIEIQDITVDELADIVADKLLDKIKHYIEELHKDKSDEYLTRQETADYLKIDPSTLWHWTNKGKIKCYGIAHRRYYNKQDIIDLLKKNELKR